MSLSGGPENPFLLPVTPRLKVSFRQPEQCTHDGYMRTVLTDIRAVWTGYTYKQYRGGIYRVVGTPSYIPGRHIQGVLTTLRTPLGGVLCG